MLETPDMNAVLQMGPHKGRIERDNHLLVPADYSSSDGAFAFIYTCLKHH